MEVGVGNHWSRTGPLHGVVMNRLISGRKVSAGVWLKTWINSQRTNRSPLCRCGLLILADASINDVKCISFIARQRQTKRKLLLTGQMIRGLMKPPMYMRVTVLQHPAPGMCQLGAMC